MTKRVLKFVFSDGTEKAVELKKVTALRVPPEHSKICLHIDRLDDGYLLIVDEKFWDVEKQKLIRIDVAREDG